MSGGSQCTKDNTNFVKIKTMKPGTQKLVDQRNQKAVKAIQELQKLPYSQEQLTNQVNQAYKAHNQVNPNKKKG